MRLHFPRWNVGFQVGYTIRELKAEDKEIQLRTWLQVKDMASDGWEYQDLQADLCFLGLLKKHHDTQKGIVNV